ncbi:MAG: RNA-guided endonuclease TnpB family protein [bacterium]|nr:RNA-guided endonuclease TnpB family protein [bacterium]
MNLAHKIRLNPTVKQLEYFNRACGTSRFVWNTALAEWKRQYEAGEKPKAATLKKQFNQSKYELYPWLKDIHRDAHSQPFANLDKAFKRFFKKQGRHPQFKRKGEHDSFYVANDQMKVVKNRVRLPKIGWVRMREELRFNGKIMSATVSRSADQWFISVNVDVQDYRLPRKANGIVGIDLGLKTAATLSNGTTFESPKPLKNNLEKLAREQRRLSRKQKGSNNRQKQKIKVARVYLKIRNLRQDFIHKLTTKICSENQAVVIEDLCVKGMMKNRKLSRATSDLGYYEIRRQLTYKSEIYDTTLVVANRWFPSSKTCSQCGNVKSKLSLSERAHICDVCGFTLDRDVNAAINLRGLYTDGLSGINACGQGSSGDYANNRETTMNEAGTNHVYD